MQTALDVITISVTGLMVGNEFAIAAFVHPALTRLAANAHLAAAREVARRLGRTMPLWYALGFGLLLAELWAKRHDASRLNLLAVAAVLWAATIGITIALLVPRNNRIARADPEHPYPGWMRDRTAWDLLHRIRVAVLALAFLLLAISLLRR